MPRITIFLLFASVVQGDEDSYNSGFSINIEMSYTINFQIVTALYFQTGEGGWYIYGSISWVGSLLS